MQNLDLLSIILLVIMVYMLYFCFDPGVENNINLEVSAGSVVAVLCMGLFGSLNGLSVLMLVLTTLAWSMSLSIVSTLAFHPNNKAREILRLVGFAIWLFPINTFVTFLLRVEARM